MEINLQDKVRNLKDSSKKKILAGAAVAIAVTGIAIGAAGVLTPSSDEISVNDPAPIVEMVDLDTAATVDESDSSQDEEKQERRYANRGFWGSAAYAVGWVVTTLLTPLARFLLVPLLMFGAIILGLKLKFPDTPLKELLTKKNVSLIILAIAVVMGGVKLASIYLVDASKIIKIAELIFGLVITGFAIFKINKKEIQEVLN